MTNHGNALRADSPSEPPAPKLTSRFNDALVYATDMHSRQTRKGGGEVPYIAHLLGVTSLVLEAGGDEDLAIAALLHDAVEDQGGRPRLEEIRRKFGDRVARIVEECSDTDGTVHRPWRERKQRYIDHLRDAADADVQLVSAADKLYNARSILTDIRRLGDPVFDRFRGRKDGTMWYYRELVHAFREAEKRDRNSDGLHGRTQALVDEFERTVEQLERVACHGGDSWHG